jgi:mRNA-degrading endonuclease RelE of RelBE toxin-antitoxin system
VYKVVWKNTAAKQLAKIDKKMARKITDKVEDYLAKEIRLLYDADRKIKLNPIKIFSRKIKKVR